MSTKLNNGKHTQYGGVLNLDYITRTRHITMLMRYGGFTQDDATTIINNACQSAEEPYNPDSFKTNIRNAITIFILQQELGRIQTERGNRELPTMHGGKTASKKTKKTTKHKHK